MVQKTGIWSDGDMCDDEIDDLSDVDSDTMKRSSVLLQECVGKLTNCLRLYVESRDKK